MGFLFPPVFDAWKPLIDTSPFGRFKTGVAQIQAHPTDSPRSPELSFPSQAVCLSNADGSVFVSYGRDGLLRPEKKTAKSEGRSFWEVVFHMDQFRELPYGNNCNVTQPQKEQNSSELLQPVHSNTRGQQFVRNY